MCTHAQLVDKAVCILDFVMAMYLGSLERVSIPANLAQTSSLLCLEEQDGAVTKVEVDEVLGLCMIFSMYVDGRFDAWPVQGVSYRV